MKLLSAGAEISCPLSVLERVGIMFFFSLRKYMRIFSGHWKLMMLDRVWTRLLRLSANTKVTHVIDDC